MRVRVTCRAVRVHLELFGIGPVSIHDPQIDRAVEFLSAQGVRRPRVGIVLGTGHARVASHLDAPLEIAYQAIPHFPRATALGHAGRFLWGTLQGVEVAVMKGRFHRYEGYTWGQVTLPVRVLSGLGIEALIVTNASGGVNPQLRSGDLLVIDDHVNLMFGSPLLEPALSRNARLLDMSAPYDAALIDAALSGARQHNIHAVRGIYAAMTGPNYETRAEYRFLRQIGVDVVGMSTVPEVLLARDIGLRVLGISAVTNLCRPDAPAATSGQAVIAAAESTEPKLRDIVSEVVRTFVKRPS